MVPLILRGDYVSLLERAHRDDRDFMEFIAERELESRKEMLRLDPVPWGGAGKCPVPCVTVRAKTEERDLRRQRAGCRDVSGVFLCARAPGGRCLVRG